MSQHQWAGRSIVDPDDVHELEQAAAVHEFGEKLPRHEAEAKAYDKYVREKRTDAAAHHLAGVRAAQGAGDMKEAQKHGLLLELHLKALGHEGSAVPPEVAARLQAPGRDRIYKFKAHKGDTFALADARKPAEPEGLDKSEGRCSWGLAERRCKNQGSKRVNGKVFCHHHEPHADSKSKRLATLHKAASVLQALFRLK